MEKKRKFDRDEKKKELQENSDVPKSIAIIHKASAKKQKRLPAGSKMMSELKNWSSVEGEAKHIGKKIKWVEKGEYSSEDFITTLCPLFVESAEMGEDGDYYKHKKQKEAKYKMTLTTGLADVKLPESVVTKEMQNECIQHVYNTSEKILKFAYADHEVFENSIETSESEKHFMESAKKCGDHGKVILTKKVYDFRGTYQRMRYWKKNRDGIFEEFSPAEIPVGALVMAQVNYCAYDFKGYHGVSGLLGRDLFVIWSPKIRTKEEIQDEEAEEKEKHKKEAVKNALSDVPFFEF